MTVDAWSECSMCKKPISFSAKYWECSVSTCNRKRTALRFCSVRCWDTHLPGARHREAWAVEEISPSREEARQQRREEAEAAARRDARSSASSATREPVQITLRDKDLPHDILIVASKLKSYIRARSGLRTSDGVMEHLSQRLRNLCDRAILNAGQDGRRTLMPRDFELIPE